MGQLTQTTAQVQVILDDADAANVGKTSLTDSTDTTAVAVRKSGFYSLGASSSNAPSTDRAILISAVRDTTATGEIRYGQVAITESNGMWWNRDDGGVLGTWYEAVSTAGTQTLTNKTLTSPVLTTPQINDTSADHQYVFAVSELVADRTVTLPLLTGNDTFVFEAHTQTLTNKTLTSPVFNTGVSGTAVLDDDTFATASSTTLATSESIKAYVDATVTGEDLDFAGDSGTGAVDLDSQTFTIAGTANEIETAASSQTLTIGLPDSVTITTALSVDTINEKTAAAGVTVDSLLIKDGGITAGGTSTFAGQTISDLGTVTTANIDGGSIDGTTIGASTAAAGTFTTVTADGGVSVDNITIDGTEIDLSSGDLTIDVAGDIILDADGGDVFLRDAGSEFGRFQGSNQDFLIRNDTQDKDISIVGNDGGTTITALAFDMSDAGAATFNSGADFGGTVTSDGLTVDGSSVLSVDSAGITTVLQLRNDDKTDDNGLRLDFNSLDSSNNDNVFGRIELEIKNHTLEKSNMVFSVRNDSGNLTELLELDKDEKIIMNGNVGIGTSPASELHVKGSTPDLRVENTTASETVSLSLIKTATKGFSINNKEISGTNYLTFNLDTAGAGTDAMVIHPTSGNVGIGTSSNLNDQLTVGSSTDAFTAKVSGAVTTIRLGGHDSSVAAGRFDYDRSTGNLTYKEGTYDSEGSALFSILYDGRVGIGTDSPDALLSLNASAPDFTFKRSGTTEFRMGVANTTNGGVTGSVAGDTFFRTLNDKMLFSVDNGVTANMTLDSSGNLLVGGITNDTPGLGDTDVGASFRADGASFVSRTLSDTSGSTLYVNRNTNDGNLAQFQKDGTTVGSIGTYNSNTYYLGNATKGITTDSISNVVPCNSSGVPQAGGYMTLGASSYPWNDLYLAGGVYVGGTGAANKLDDYEEGTWTPVAKSGSTTITTTNNLSTYTKIGRYVFIQGYIQRNDSASLTDVLSIVSLPFNTQTGNASANGSFWVDGTSTDEVCTAYFGGASSSMTLKKVGANSDYVTADQFQNGRPIYFSAAYMTAT